MTAPARPAAFVAAMPSLLTPTRRRAIRHALVAVGLVSLPYVIWINHARSQWGFDAWAYWSIDLGQLYDRSLGTTYGFGAFRYTPAVGQLFSTFSAIPWEAFFVAWFVAMVATLAWLTGRKAILLLAFPPLVLELYHANIHLFMAAAIVLSFRWPATWAFVALTKVTPAVGALWFAFRGEWRKFGIAVGATLALAAVSFVVAPDLWRQYVVTMIDNYGVPADDPLHTYPIPVPLPIRLAMAVVIVWWAARTDRRWLVPVACTIALPIIWWHGLSMLLAAIPLWYADRRAREGAGSDAGADAGADAASEPEPATPGAAA